MLNALEGLDFGIDFSGLFSPIIEEEYLRKSTYEAYLADPEGSELLYLGAHSDPQTHMLYDDWLTVDELKNMKKISIFHSSSL